MGGLNVNRKRFMITGAAGFAALLAVLTLLVATGTIFAATPIAGMGGFMVKADEIQGTNYEMLPSLTDSNNEGNNVGTIPAAQNYMQSVKIKGMVLEKVIDANAIMTGKKVKIVITSDPSQWVVGTGLVQQASYIVAESAEFPSGQLIDENLGGQESLWSSSLLTQQKGGIADIGLQAPAIALKNAQIVTHRLKVDSMTIPNMKVSLELL